MPPKTEQEIESYVRKHKGSFASLYKDRWGKPRISFRNRDTGRFEGNIARTKESENAVRNIISIKARIRVKIPGEKRKRTLTYNIYNEEQRDNVLFLMNDKLRDKEKYKKRQKKRGNISRNFSEDRIPFIKGKNKVDLLFDKYKLQKVVKIDQYEGGS